MFASRLIPVAFAVIFSAAALAQEAPAPVTDAKPTAAAAMPHDCTKQMARHDHGAEKGTPTPKMAGCAMEKPAVSPVKGKAGHDHAKFHKLM
jgi:hypothetical protein